jgi:hypothetical protein
VKNNSHILKSFILFVIGSMFPFTVHASEYAIQRDYAYSSPCSACSPTTYFMSRCNTEGGTYQHTSDRDSNGTIWHTNQCIFSTRKIRREDCQFKTIASEIRNNWYRELDCLLSP